MIRTLTFASLLALALPTIAAAQPAPGQQPGGTRLDVVATGEVNRVPDIMHISAGVMTQAPTATEVIRQNAARMDSVRAALRRAGIADRDIQTSSINLEPEWRHAENRAPEFVGYRSHNMVTVRFRDIANAGRVLDALVAAGSNQINGPSLGIERPQAALDEARTNAIGVARQRAELYARSLGMRVRRILSVSEVGANYMPPQPMMMRDAIQVTGASSTSIDPGEQLLSVSVTVSFELE
jgi:hypothetical protein